MKALFLALLLSFSTLSFSFDHTHKKWDEILKNYVLIKDQQALFNYKKLKSSPKKLKTYLRSLSSVSLNEYQKWNNNQKLSFLINAYNAFTVKLIIDKYPVDSIRDIKEGFFTNAWKIKFFTLLGEKTHLDHIEHDLIRKNFKEPRIHFAVVCASISCPNLAKSSFTPENLNNLLAKNANHFLLDSNKNKWDGKTLYLSKIFKWYGGDFDILNGGYKSFIAEKLGKDSSQITMIKKASVEWTEYDWSLNEWK